MRLFPLILLALLAPGGCRSKPRPPQSRLIVWAWERPEDLRFASGSVEVAALTGFIELSKGDVTARGRPFPVKLKRPPDLNVVHVEIAPAAPPEWTPVIRRRLAAAILHYAQIVPARRVQLDFEVKASERQILLEAVSDLRGGLPKGTFLSMTALASWCDTETWLSSAPVDEIVPMLFRMQPGGAPLKNRLAAGRDFRNPRCRTALGISTDSPIERAPPGRRVYLFSPRSWTEADFQAARRAVEAWR